jgi:hypothetical protein
LHLKKTSISFSKLAAGNAGGLLTIITKKRSPPSWLPHYFGGEENFGGTVFAASSANSHIRLSSSSMPPTRCGKDGNNSLHVKGILLGTIESVGQEPAWMWQPIKNFEPFHSFLVAQVMNCQGRIRELDRAVSDIIRINYSKPDELVQVRPEVQETLNLELKAMEEAETIQEANEMTLRIGEQQSSLRTAFAFSQTEGSRTIQGSNIDIPFGLGIPAVEPGDRVYSIIGCRMSLVLRQFDFYHEVVGKAWMFGSRDGISLLNNFKLVPGDVLEDISLR